MRTLTATVVAQGRTYQFTGRKALELRYWAESPHKPLLFCDGPHGPDFMYHPMGLEPKDVTINCVETLQAVC